MARGISYRQFWREVTRNGRGPCALRGHDCGGAMDAHHFVPKRVIALQLTRRAPLAAALTDTRNGVPLCRHHHDLVEQGRADCPRPSFLDYFLVEHGLYERTGSVRGQATVRRPADPR